MSVILTPGHLTDIFGPGSGRGGAKEVEIPKYLLEPAKENGMLNIGAGKKTIEGAYNIDYKNANPQIGVHQGDATDLSNNRINWWNQ